MSSNNNIKGLTVEIGGDTTKLGAALRGADQSIQSSAKELRELDKLLKLDPKNTELLQQKQEVLAESIGKTKERLDTLRTAQEQAKPRLENYDAWKQKNDVLSGSITEVEKKLARLRAAQEDLTETEGVDSASYSELAEQIAATEKQIKKLKKEQKDLADEYGHPISPESYRSLQREISRTEQTLRDYERQQKDAAKAADELNHAADNAADSSSDLGKAAEQAGRQIEDSAKQAADAAKNTAKDVEDIGEESEKSSKKVSSFGDVLKGTLVADAIQAGARAIKNEINEIATDTIEFGATFESAMSKVATIADTTQLPLKNLQAQILELSTKTGKSAAEIAESVYSAISGGVDTASAVAVVEKATQLAEGGFTDTATAIDVLTTATNAYGLSIDDAAKLSDYLLTTQNLGKTTVDELAGSMGKVIPLASAYGVQMDNLSTAYAIMTANGIATTESTTYLKSMLNELGDSGSTVSKVLKKQTGKTFAELNAEGASLGDVLAILGDSVDGDTGKFNELWSSSEAGIGALSILGSGTERYAEVLGAMRDSTGTTEAAYATMTDTFEHKSAELKNTLENLEIEAFGGFKESVKGAMSEINKELQSEKTKAAVKKLGAAFGDLTAEAGKLAVKSLPVLADALSFVVKNVGKLTTSAIAAAVAIKGFKIASTATKAVNTFKDALTGGINKLGLIITVIAGLVSAFSALDAAIETESEKQQRMKQELQELAQAYKEASDAALEAQKARADAAKDIADEYDGYRDLIKELDGIVDANGEIKAGYEERAAYITGRLSEVAGIEIQITDGVIQKYGELADMLDTVLLKKQAEALLTSQQGDYDAAKAAIDSTEKDENGVYAAGSRMAYETAQAEYLNAKEALPQYEAATRDYEAGVFAIYDSYSAIEIMNGAADTQLEKLLEEYDAKIVALNDRYGYEAPIDAETVEMKRQAAEDAHLAYDVNAATVSSYENLQTAAWGNDPEALAAAIGESTAALMTAATASLASLTKQLSDARTEYEEWSKLSTQENSTITAKDLAEKRNRALRAAYEVQQEMLQNSEDYTQQELDEAEQMFMDSLRSIWNLTDDQLSEVAEVMGKYGFDAGVRFGDGLVIGLGSTASVVQGAAAALAKIPASTTGAVMEIASPSKVAIRQGRYYGKGLSLGLEREAETVAQKAARLARSITETVDGELPAPAMALVQQGTNFAPTAAYHESGSNGTLEDVSTRLDAILAVVQAINPRLVLDDGTLVAKTASKTNDALGIITERERRGRL